MASHLSGRILFAEKLDWEGATMTRPIVHATVFEFGYRRSITVKDGTAVFSNRRR